MNLSYIFRIFKMAVILMSKQTFQPEVVPEDDLNKGRPLNSLDLDILIDALAQISTELWQFQNLTLFVTL